MGAISAFYIDETDHNRKSVLRAIKSAPKYGEQVVRVIKQTIRVIHGTPGVTETLKLPDMDIYLGRSTPKNVLSRWRDHQMKKKHIYGAILFTCSSSLSLKLEKLALKLLKQLKTRGSLCVGMANAVHDARGNRPGEDSAVIYLTWGKSNPTKYEKPTRKINRQVAEDVYSMRSGIGLKLTRKQLENALETTRAPLTEKEHLNLKRL